jgi:hypothetical protein
MPPQAAAGRWPGISFGNDPVLFHPDGGVIDAERAMTAMRELAAARGAQLQYESRWWRSSRTRLHPRRSLRLTGAAFGAFSLA